MNEIGGSAASYIPVLKASDDVQTWAINGAENLKSLLAMSEKQRKKLVNEGIENVTRFNADDAIEGYLKVYRQVLAMPLTVADLNIKPLLARKKSS